MADFVDVPVPAVVRHAAAVDGVTEEVRAARAAVTQVTMDPGAYGMLCGFLPGILSGVFEVAVVAMNGSAEALQETALNLRAAVRLLEDTDNHSAREIGSP
ncbi:type VII secretion target [Actinoplanes sp. DH11]|uniref:type VII secretion target n=1 Tax=Actinoplanes sp. DH11 TaxID=2857011 RepID=UPI001E5F167D|nr:type VII secretion target [Actinoplanes sp. DH11]